MLTHTQDQRHTWFAYRNHRDIATIQDLTDLYGFYRVSLFWPKAYVHGTRDFKTYALAVAYLKDTWAIGLVWC